MKPLVKWPGGKRQLLPGLLSRMPLNYNTYYEPFLGGGAMAFSIGPDRAVLNDMNEALVNLYEIAAVAGPVLAQALSDLESWYDGLPDMDAKRACYDELRAEYNTYLVDGRPDGVRCAALLVFLNKAGYNGMYRVNSKGAFNVPFGKRETVKLFDQDNLDDVSAFLGKSIISCGDFASAVEGASKGDFVFFDSPYHGTFDTYQKGGFSEDDHERLAWLFRELDQVGVKCMLTNSDTPFIRDLYRNYSIEAVGVRRSVSCDAKRRTGVEIIVRNY